MVRTDHSLPSYICLLKGHLLPLLHLGIDHLRTAGAVVCFKSVVRNVRTMVRYRFKVKHAKGEDFHVGYFGTCNSIANVNCTVSLNRPVQSRQFSSDSIW